MMCYGNERFTQYLASSNSTFQLSNFLDKSGVQGYDMSPFIRRYAKYLNEKALSYRTVAFDFCKVKRGKEDGMLRTMNTDKLLKTLPVLQNQLDALLEFDCSANDLTNGVINMSFMLLFRDLIRLFACYNDGIINLLEKFFDMNKKQCKEALDIYKKFLVRMDRVGEFLKVAENVGIDKGDIPDLTKAPSSLLDALEQHYSHLDGKKSSSTQSSNQKNVKSGVTALSSTSNAFGNVVANGRFDTSNGIDENLKLQILAEEEAAINRFKSKLQSPTGTSSSTANNPFLSNSSSSATVSSASNAHVDLFVADPVPVNQKASDDLLQLSNPFADAFSQPHLANTIVANNAASPFMSPPPQQNNAWITNGNGFGNTPTASNPVITNGSFVSENNFATVFGNPDSKASNFDALGGVLQPMSANGGDSTGQTSNSPDPNNGNNNIGAPANQTSGQGLLTGDLESSLASLAENLTINSRTATVKGVQWNSPKNGSKTGSSWTPQPISDTTNVGYKPMNQSMQSSPFSSMTVTSTPAQIYPPMMGIRPVGASGTHAMIAPISAMSQVNQAPNQMGQSILFY
nr:unnamed protein product [Callosobruchus analis]